jgi:UDP-N-acetylmuramyl pentapeptide phosphotransferase/UDP-N-acetylglucosamine-1-phosphate transferase
VHEKGEEMGSFVLGGVMAVLALMSLFVASAAKDGVFYTTGLGLFLFCVLFIFVMIHRLVGR